MLSPKASAHIDQCLARARDGDPEADRQMRQILHIAIDTVDIEVVIELITKCADSE